MVKLTKQSEVELHEAGCRSGAKDEYRSSFGAVTWPMNINEIQCKYKQQQKWKKNAFK